MPPAFFGIVHSKWKRNAQRRSRWQKPVAVAGRSAVPPAPAASPLPQKIRFPAWPSCCFVKLLLKSRFRFFYQGSESCRIVNRNFREHFPIQLHAGFFQAVHKGRIVYAVDAASSRNSGDPQASEISFSLLPAYISIVAGFHDSLFGHLKVSALRSKITFCQL